MKVDMKEGYVFYIRAYATAQNRTFAGFVKVMYGGTNRSFLGNDGFAPYKSEKSAERGRKSWEKLFSELAVIDKSWRYQLGGVMPVTDAMYKELDEQREKEYEIIRKTPNPVAEALEKSLEKEFRRMNFMVIK